MRLCCVGSILSGGAGEEALFVEVYIVSFVDADDVDHDDEW